MKVLLDENLPHRLRLAIPGHDVSTVAYLGWSGIRNGDLIQRAEAEGFEVLVTADQNIQYQQNLIDRRIALVCLTEQQWEVLSKSLERIVAAVDASAPGAYHVVECRKNA